MAPRPLSLPLEVIERILELAFLPNALPSDPESTETTPPSSTSHLLLISKAIRQICLPFFWRSITSITIARPQDWIALFDPKEGLVVVGEEGRKRWELVEELRIVVEAVVPVSMGPRQSDSYLTPLFLLSFRRLPNIVFEHLPPSLVLEPPSWIAKEEERVSFRSRFFALKEDLQAWDHPKWDYIMHLNGGEERNEKEETTEERARRIMEDLDGTFRHDLDKDGRIFLSTILESFQPRHAVIDYDHWYNAELGDLLSDEVIWPFHFPCNLQVIRTTSSSLFRNAHDHPIYSLQALFQTEGEFTCKLVGFESEHLGALEDWAMNKGSSFAKDLRWTSSWSWKREDGSTFFIDFSKCRE